MQKKTEGKVVKESPELSAGREDRFGTTDKEMEKPEQAMA